MVTVDGNMSTGNLPEYRCLYTCSCVLTRKYLFIKGKILKFFFMPIKTNATGGVKIIESYSRFVGYFVTTTNKTQ